MRGKCASLALLACLVFSWMGSGPLTTEAQVSSTDTPFPTETKENIVTATYDPRTPTVTPFPATPTKAEGGGVGGQGGLVRQFYLPLISRSEAIILPTPTTTLLPTLTAPAPPPASLSRYMSIFTIDSTNKVDLYNLGQQRGGCNGGPPAQPKSFLILAFGSAWDNHTLTSAASAYGVALYPDRKVQVMLDVLERNLKEFIRGYYNCVSSTNPSASLTLGVGINSWGDGSFVTAEHGRRWAQLVDNLNQYIQSPPTWAATIKAVGAVDFEPGEKWSPAANVRQWVDAYGGYAGINPSKYYFYGSCSGCPQVTRDASGNYVASYAWPLVPGSDWTMDDVWYFAYGASPAYPLPEIYLTDGTSARQWQNLALWAATCTFIPSTTTLCEPLRRNLYRDMRFVGAMTQYQACLDTANDPYPCSPLEENSPADGWRQLWQALNDPNTPLTHPGAGALQWSTDISWKH